MVRSLVPLIFIAATANVQLIKGEFRDGKQMLTVKNTGPATIKRVHVNCGFAASFVTTCWSILTAPPSKTCFQIRRATTTPSRTPQASPASIAASMMSTNKNCYS